MLSKKWHPTFTATILNFLQNYQNNSHEISTSIDAATCYKTSSSFPVSQLGINRSSQAKFSSSNSSFRARYTRNGCESSNPKRFRARYTRNGCESSNPKRFHPKYTRNGCEISSPNCGKFLSSH